jgi:hypothetical protein
MTTRELSPMLTPITKTPPYELSKEDILSTDETYLTQEEKIDK